MSVVFSKIQLAVRLSLLHLIASSGEHVDPPLGMKGATLRCHVSRVLNVLIVAALSILEICPFGFHLRLLYNVPRIFSCIQ
jgi:hypothetical protein